MKTFKRFLKEQYDQYLNNSGDKFVWNPEDIQTTEDATVSESLFENDEEWLGTEDPNKEAIYFKELINQSIDNMKKLHKTNPLDDNEKAALYHYTGAGYRNINHILRHRDLHSTSKYPTNLEDPYINNKNELKNIKLKQTIKEHAKHLDSAIAKHTTEYPTHVWRGTKSPGIENFNNLKPGDTFHDKGYVSTSANPEIAQRFLDRGHEKPGHIMHIKVPKGSKALHVLSHDKGAMRTENEVILPRGSKFRYDGKTEHEHGTVHHLTHIPEGSE